MTHSWDMVDDDAQVIDLMRMTERGQVYFIRLGSTAKYYRQQVAGLLCDHRIVEGDAMLVEGVTAEDIPHVGCCDSITHEEVMELTPLLERLGFTYLENQDSTEAWIHVRRGYGEYGVLTWENCD